MVFFERVLFFIYTSCWTASPKNFELFLDSAHLKSILRKVFIKLASEKPLIKEKYENYSLFAGTAED